MSGWLAEQFFIGPPDEPKLTDQMHFVHVTVGPFGITDKPNKTWIAGFRWVSYTLDSIYNKKLLRILITQLAIYSWVGYSTSTVPTRYRSGISLPEKIPANGPKEVHSQDLKGSFTTAFQSKVKEPCIVR